MSVAQKDTLTDWLMLAFTPNIGPVTFLKLIQKFGCARGALSADDTALEQIIHKKAVSALKNREAEPFVEQALIWSEGKDCSLLTLQDDDYPISLVNAHAPPTVLFLRGQSSVLQTPMISIVGSRHATAQAIQTAKNFAQALSVQGFTIVSGFAAGIDTAAHQGALEGSGKTVGVFGTGIDRIYPASNKEMAVKTLETGVLLSEFPLGTRPLANNFPRRNRIIAALSDATLVVEASIQSGSLITARLANEMGKSVLAVPGSIHNPQTKGCHQLIKNGAKLVETLEDILEELPINLKPQPIMNKNLVSSEPEQNLHPVLNIMGFDPIHPDSLAQMLNMDAATVHADLLELELDGKILPCPGGCFQRIIN